MAVPKKRTSKSKTNIRKNAWKIKVEKQAIRALSLAKYLLKTEPEDRAVEKLLKSLNDKTPSKNETAVTEGYGGAAGEKNETSSKNETAYGEAAAEGAGEKD